MARVPWCRLKNGLEIRQILNGMWQVSGAHGPINPNKASRAMMEYFDAGLTTFDMADIYGPAEDIFGEFLEQLKTERGEDVGRKVQGNISLKSSSTLIGKTKNVSYSYPKKHKIIILFLKCRVRVVCCMILRAFHLLFS